MNFPYVQPSNLHCQKCGRRSRNPTKDGNKRRVKSEQRHCRHGHLLKCHRQQERLFPIESFAINSNHPSNQLTHNVLIDQFIQVQQLDTTRCNTRSHSYTYDIDNDHRLFRNKLHRVHQMIYLRENINNLMHREHHFANEYIILKRLEEKNNLRNQNRYQADQYFRTFKLQYQIRSVLLENITITTFSHDAYQTESIVRTPLKQFSFSKSLEFNQDASSNIINHSISGIKPSFPTLLESNDSITEKNSIDQHVEPIDLSALNATDDAYRQQQQHSLNTNHLDQRNSLYNTAVIVDVTKCSHITNFPHRQQTMYLPWPQNTNYPEDTISYNLIHNESRSHETTWFSPDFKASNGNQHLTVNDRTITNLSSKSEKSSSSSTNSDFISEISTAHTNTTENSRSRKYTQVISKLKEILNTLQKKLLKLNISFPSKCVSARNVNQTSDSVGKSIIAMMTTDSLLSNTSLPTTYSVSSILSLTNKNDRKSTVNIENDILSIELDSLNSQRESNLKLLNLAKNINTNQQTSDDERTRKSFHYARLRSTPSLSRRMTTVQYMSPSFMFVLQILLIICLLHRILIHDFVLIDPSMIVDHLPSSTEGTIASTNEEIFNKFLSSLFKLT